MSIHLTGPVALAILGLIERWFYTHRKKYPAPIDVGTGDYLCLSARRPIADRGTLPTDPDPTGFVGIFSRSKIDHTASPRKIQHWQQALLEMDRHVNAKKGGRLC